MKTTKRDDLFFQYYLVIFFDLLGQRQALRKIPDLPTSSAETDKFIELTRDSVGKVLAIRKAFKNYFDGALSHVPNTDLVTPDQRQLFIESQKTDFHHYGLSDAIVIVVPLKNNDENCTAINSIYSALTATCGIKLLALSLGVPARAGIDVGVGVQIDDREIYGPALEKATRIESQLAEYPRLVVGEGLLSYLDWVEKQNCKTTLGEIALTLAKLCREWLVQDTDGRIMLDYLGSSIKQAFENNVDKDLVINAWRYVKQQHKKFADQGNYKLSARYFRMLRYFESRLSIWEIEGKNS